jgi:hypothetical protein
VPNLDHFAAPRDHVVDQTVLYGLFGGHETIAIQILVDLFDRLAGVLGVDLVQPLAKVEDLLRLDLDVRGRSLHST